MQRFEPSGPSSALVLAVSHSKQERNWTGPNLYATFWVDFGIGCTEQAEEDSSRNSYPLVMSARIEESQAVEDSLCSGEIRSSVHNEQTEH